MIRNRVVLNDETLRFLKRKIIIPLIGTIFIMSASMVNAQKYVFYLHGAILEGENPQAKGDIFEKYRYNDILNSFRKAGFEVVSEIRPSDATITGYARKVADQMQKLIQNGAPAGNITVVGGSKGALIAMYVSTYMKNRDINYVFLAACNAANFQSNPDLRFYGNILSIYESSDDIGETCSRFKERSKEAIHHYKEIELSTGMGHQFLWKPLPEWINPSIAWANGKYD